MIKRAGYFEWPKIDLDHYKNEPGTWQDVSRRVLFTSEESSFETRYFEVQPQGYTSYEQHKHEHCVIVLRGSGEVFLESAWASIEFGDVVHVQPNQPHQFRNTGDEPFGILCVVDKKRDRPTLLGNQPNP